MSKKIKSNIGSMIGLSVGSGLYDFRDKDKNVQVYMSYMLNRSLHIFDWKDLPETISQRNLELIIQKSGCAGVTKVNGELYAFFGDLGGEPDIYYMPTIFTIGNPHYTGQLKIDKECIVIPNDSLYIGMLPMYQRYASELVENDITMQMANITNRMNVILSADDDTTKTSAEAYIDDIITGKIGVIAESDLIEDIKRGLNVHQSNAGTNIRMTDFIELQQYIKASWFNEIGLNANYNMKRESINSDEAQLNDDALIPLIDDMLICRKLACDKINALFNTNISVELSDIWKNNRDEALSDETPNKTEAEPEVNTNETD